MSIKPGSDAVRRPVAAGAPIQRAPDAVPTAVSAFQARAALLRRGLLAAVDGAISASSDPEALLAWEYAVEFQRHGPLLNAIAAQLGLTDEQIDTLFREAAGITA